MNKIKLYNSIFFQQARNALAIGMVLIVFATVAQVASNLSAEQRRISFDITILLDAEELSAVSAAYRLDEDLAKSIVQRLSKSPFIYSISLNDNYGSAIASFSKERRKASALSDRLTSFIKIKEVYFTRLLYGKEKLHVGTLKIYIDKTAITDTLIKQLMAVFINRFITIIILFVTLLFVFYLTMTKPIVSVIDRISAIESRKFESVQLPVPAAYADNELGLLIASVNSLLSRIGEQTDELRRSEAEKALILDNASEIIAYHDTDHNLQWVNKAYLNSTGSSLTAIKGKKCYHAWGLDRICNNCPVTKATETGTSQSGELTPKNQPHWPADQGCWVVRASPVRDADGNITGAIEIAHDITERKKTEEELAKYRDHLEGMVVERTQALEAVNKELSAFSYSVAHDVRAPLRSIDGFSKALLEDSVGSLSEECKGHLNHIRSASHLMAQFLDDMLNLAHVSQAAIAHENVDLSKIAQSVGSELKEIEPSRDTEFVIEPGVVVSGDATLLGLVIRNLLDNAWKFTAKKAHAKIEFGYIQKDGRRAYFVRDNGAGFDAAYIDKLFVPFQRLHSKSEFMGTGIGLSIVKRIIHRHGGYVWAEGSVGQGATFYFTL